MILNRDNNAKKLQAKSIINETKTLNNSSYFVIVFLANNNLYQ